MKNKGNKNNSKKNKNNKEQNSNQNNDKKTKKNKNKDKKNKKEPPESNYCRFLSSSSSSLPSSSSSSSSAAAASRDRTKTAVYEIKWEGSGICELGREALRLHPTGRLQIVEMGPSHSNSMAMTRQTAKRNKSQPQDDHGFLTSPWDASISRFKVCDECGEHSGLINEQYFGNSWSGRCCRCTQHMFVVVALELCRKAMYLSTVLTLVIGNLDIFWFLGLVTRAHALSFRSREFLMIPQHAFEIILGWQDWFDFDRFVNIV